MWRRRLLPPLLFLLLLAAVCAPFAAAQAAAHDSGNANPRNVDATQFGERITLGPNWFFAPGDNPAWASSTFDDSGWKTVSAEKPLTDYGYRDLNYAWYQIGRASCRERLVGSVGA